MSGVFYHGPSKIVGGSIDNTSIGSTTPSTGIFTDATVDQTLSIQGAGASGFYYRFAPSTITADRNMIIPLLTTDDTIVFDDHPATFTNKTITDASNNVAASSLHHVSGVTTISSAAAPLYDQTLRADDPTTTASWRHDDMRRSVRVATTTSGTLASDFENGDSVDGIVLATNDRILIKNQVSGIENGIYIVQASGAPLRAPDFPSGTNAASCIVFAQEGSQNMDTGFLCTNNTGSDVVGTDAISWQSFTALVHKISIMVQPLEFAAHNVLWDNVAYLPWSSSEHGSYADGKIVYRASVPSTQTLDIRVYDVTNATVLGSDLGVSTSGTRTFLISNPISDAEVVLQIQRSASGTPAHPSIRGVLVEYCV